MRSGSRRPAAKGLRFEGVYPALLTPMAGGALDEAALRRLIRSVLRGGASGIVPCGSTGEAATLRPAEYRRVVEIAVSEAAGRCPVVAGIGTNATWRAVDEAREAERLGANALLVLAPYYNKPTQEGLYRHFREVAGAVNVPIVVYNIPGRTAVNIHPATLARLARDCPNVAAVKEASGSLDQVSEIVSLAPRGFTVLSGDDSLTLPMLAVGGRGVVSVVANIAPRETVAMVSAFLQGRTEAAKRLHLRLFPLVKSLFLETNPIPLKTAASMLGLCRDELRLPLVPMSKAPRKALARELRRFGLL